MPAETVTADERELEPLRWVGVLKPVIKVWSMLALL
jgi:hypothetical protein